MAKRSLGTATVTTAATADTTALANTTYAGAILGGSATQKIALTEIFLGGQSASTSQPQIGVLGRDSTVAVTLAAGGTVDQALDAATAALAAPPVTGNTAGTPPQRSATLGRLLVLAFNAYGGMARWLARDRDEEITLVGNTASLGELSLSFFTGTTAGAVGGHMVYEPY
jgi:hypothetical protein